MQAAKLKITRTLMPVRPNAGVETWYKRQLMRLIIEMARSVSYWMRVEYNQSGLAQDAAPDNLAAELKVLGDKWQARFNGKVLTIAKMFADRVRRHADAQLQSRLRARGMNAIKFKPTKEMRDVLSATIQEQVGLIKSIPQEYLLEVQGIIMRSALKGRDVGGLSEELKQRYTITHRRANTIARDQNNKATASMMRARQTAMGIKEGIWHHSHAGKQPRPSHVRANGKKFNLKTGMLIDGEYIMPGEKINCRCTWSAVIPGFED